MTIAAVSVSVSVNAGADLLSNEASAARRALVRRTARTTLRRRRVLGHLSRGACLLALVLVLIPLVALVVYTVSRGVPGISAAFFTQLPTPPDVPGLPPGGISNAIVGTLIIVGGAAAMAVPTGLAVALFLLERRGGLAGSVRFVADVMTGIPSIAIGVFAYALIVVPSHSYSGLSASFALAVLMLPIMIRANEVAMRTVPDDLKEAGLALGVRRSRVARSVVLRGALPGIVSGNLLALARAMGETAPLLFTALGGALLMATNPLHPMAAIPLSILNDGTQPQSSLQTTAWATALTLLVFVLVLSVVGRTIAGYLNRHAR
jgi:phosphate transport system permease protein